MSKAETEEKRIKRKAKELKELEKWKKNRLVQNVNSIFCISW